MQGACWQGRNPKSAKNRSATGRRAGQLSTGMSSRSTSAASVSGPLVRRSAAGHCHPRIAAATPHWPPVSTCAERGYSRTVALASPPTIGVTEGPGRFSTGVRGPIRGHGAGTARGDHRHTVDGAEPLSSTRPGLAVSPGDLARVSGVSPAPSRTPSRRPRSGTVWHRDGIDGAGIPPRRGRPRASIDLTLAGVLNVEAPVPRGVAIGRWDPRRAQARKPPGPRPTSPRSRAVDRPDRRPSANPDRGTPAWPIGSRVTPRGTPRLGASASPGEPDGLRSRERADRGLAESLPGDGPSTKGYDRRPHPGLAADEDPAARGTRIVTAAQACGPRRREVPGTAV